MALQKHLLQVKKGKEGREETIKQMNEVLTSFRQQTNM